MLSYLNQVCARVWGWLPYILPALSNLILVVAGAVMSLPDLATKVEIKYKRLFGVACIVAGLVGFIFDVTARHSGDQTNKQLLRDTRTTLDKTNDLNNKTSDLVTSTNDMVSRLGLMEPEVTAQTSYLASIDRKLSVAKQQNNPELTAFLQREKQAALDKLLTLAPSIIDQLDAAHDACFYAEGRIQNTRTAAFSKEMSLTHAKQIGQDFLAALASLREDSGREAKPMMVAADYMRQELRQRLAPSEVTPEDEKYAALFAKAATGAPMEDCWVPANMAGYLRGLVKRIAPAHP